VSKYAPLGNFLRNQKTTFVPMTFAEIERVVGTRLPNSQRYPAWWSNNPFNNVMTQVWLDAGFVTEQVDVAGKKVVFRRTKPTPQLTNDGGKNTKAVAEGVEHPFFGWMKGTVHIPEGVDLTEPADPDWGESIARL
jgi:hypothetical protein